MIFSDALSPKLQEYIDHHHTLPEIFQKLETSTLRDNPAHRMLSGRQVASVLTMLCQLVNAKNVVEIGTFTG